MNIKKILVYFCVFYSLFVEGSYSYFEKPNLFVGLVKQSQLVGTPLATDSTRVRKQFSLKETVLFQRKPQSYFSIGLELNSELVNNLRNYFFKINYLQNLETRNDFETTTRINEYFIRFDIGEYFSNLDLFGIFLGISANIQSMHAQGGALVLKNGNVTTEFDLPKGASIQITAPLHVGFFITPFKRIRIELLVQGSHFISSRRSLFSYGGMSFVF